jgi:hypothetical protein
VVVDAGDGDVEGDADVDGDAEAAEEEVSNYFQIRCRQSSEPRTGPGVAEEISSSCTTWQAEVQRNMDEQHNAITGIDNEVA